MLGYHWPGNIRELENVVERGVILAPDSGAIDAVHLFSGGERVDPGHLGLGAGGTLRRVGGDAREAIDGDALERVRSRVLQLLAGVEGEDDDATTLAQIEDALVQSAVRAADGNLAAAARKLGMTRAQLVYCQKARRERPA